MKSSVSVVFQADEICGAAGISIEVLTAIVENGIVEPEAVGQSWQFDLDALAVVKRAARLKYDLEIDWPGIALAIDILGELDSLREENRMLRQRLDRFIQN